MIVSRGIRNAFFELLRCALSGQAPVGSVFAPLDGKGWKELLQLVRLQRVTGICFAVVEQLPKEVQPPINLYLQWMADRSYILSFAAKRAVVTRELLDRFGHEGIHPLVMKGWAFAQYYPDPMLRMSGDVDLYFPERFDEVLALVKRWGLDSVKGGLHDSIEYKGVHVEMHPRLIYPASLGRVDETPVEVSFPGGLSFLSPTAASNALLMLSHMARHLMISGADFCHLCDYLLLLQQVGKELDADALRSRLLDMGLGRFSDALQQIGKNYLGTDAVFYCYPASKKQDRLVGRLLEDMMINGMDGRYVKVRMQEAKNISNLFKRSCSIIYVYSCVIKRFYNLRPFWAFYADRKMFERVIGWFKHRLYKQT